MKIKTITVLLVAGLVVLATMVVFAGTAAAEEEDEDPFKIYGTITDANGNPYVEHEVVIKKENVCWGGPWRPLKGLGYKPITNDTGYYSTGWCFPVLQGYGNPIDNYRMYIDGNLVAERHIGFDDWDDHWTLCWKHRWNHQIPEFATIAIPAVAVLGLFLFYSHRKRKEE